MSTALAIPTDGDANKWTPKEKALVEAAGLVSRGNLAPRPVVEAFLSHCHRTGLDPIARQIYCIERGGKWTTQISIDGARLVAERSRQYQGQTPTEWTADGVTWLQVWLSKDNPAAARVGVYRAGFQAPLYAVATWDAYNAGSPIWKKMPALMLGKCAEMLALRKAFPQDLSGLYSAEEMDQASASTSAVEAPQGAAHASSQAPVQSSEPGFSPGDVIRWFDAAAVAKTVEELGTIWAEAQSVGALGVEVEGVALGQLLRNLKAAFEAAPQEDVQDAEVVEEEPVQSWPVADIPNGDES